VLAADCVAATTHYGVVTLETELLGVQPLTMLYRIMHAFG